MNIGDRGVWNGKYVYIVDAAVWRGDYPMPSFRIRLSGGKLRLVSQSEVKPLPALFLLAEAAE